MLSPAELAAFRRGDPALFQRLVRELSPRLLRVLRPFARAADEGHDLVQEAWQRGFARRGDFRGEGSLLGWLLAIGRNAGRERWRRRQSAVREVPEGAVASASDPALEQLGLRRALVDAVADLPQRERETLIQRLVLGRSTRETAEHLGCAEGTVKAALAHALAKLRPALEEWKP